MKPARVVGNWQTGQGVAWPIMAGGQRCYDTVRVAVGTATKVWRWA